MQLGDFIAYSANTFHCAQPMRQREKERIKREKRQREKGRIKREKKQREKERIKGKRDKERKRGSASAFRQRD